MTHLTITLTIDRADLDAATTVQQIEDALRIPVRIALASLQGSLNPEVSLVGLRVAPATPSLLRRQAH